MLQQSRKKYNRNSTTNIIKIKKSLQDIDMAEAHIAQAGKMYYRAKKRLEGIYSPTAPKRAQSLSNSEIAHLIGKRTKHIKKQQTKTA